MGTKGNTKSKLTLSVDRKHVAMLRRASMRRGKSIAELVEELAENEERQASQEDAGDAWVKRNMGILANRVKPADWKRDDRLGDLLRKHAPRNARAH